jgi:uncharacterized membrane protein YidH (DUF202 family)
MQKALDYAFYRIARFYYKWDGRRGITAIMAISLYEGLVLANIYYTFSTLFSSTPRPPFNSKLVFGILMVSIIGANIRMYSNRYNRLHLKWRDEAKNDKTKHTFYLVAALVFIIAYVVILFKIRQIVYPVK